MKSNLLFYEAASRKLSDCGAPLQIEVSSADCGWEGVVLEKGWSPHFYPTDVFTPYFYFALALEQDLRWEARHGEELQPLKTTPGEIWINPPETPFTHKIDQPCFFTILAIEAETFLDAHPEALPRDRLQFLNNYNVEDPLLKNFIEMFLFEAQSGAKNGARYLRNLLSALCEYYINNYSDYRDLAKAGGAGSSRVKSEDVNSIENFILENVDEALSVEDLAAELNMSKFYFLREFKKASGFTPHQFLVRVKMKRAAELLAGSALPLSEVALRLGFGDQSHFSRVFKSHFNASPGAYRRRASL